MKKLRFLERARGNLTTAVCDNPLMRSLGLKKFLLLAGFAWIVQSSCVGGGANPLSGDLSGDSINWASLDEQPEISDESNTIYYSVNSSGSFEIADQPLDPGYPDPMKSLDGELTNALVVKQITGTCRYSNQVKLQIQGTFLSKDGSTRILRIVDTKDKQFLNVQAEGGKEDNVNFTITTQAIEPIRVYVMRKDFVPVYLNQELACKDGKCSPKNKESIYFFTPLNVDLSQLSAPLCLQPIPDVPQATVFE